VSLAGRRIAVVCERFPNVVQPYILGQLIALQEAGVHLTIVSGLVERGAACQPEVEAHRLRVRYIGLASRPQLVRQLASYLCPDYRPGRVATALASYLAARPWCRGPKHLVKGLAKLKLMSDGPFDLVHSHYLGGSYEYLFLKEVFGVPLVTTFHGLPPVGVGKLAPEKMARVFAAGDLFLVNTRFARAQLEGLGCPAGKIAILPQGSDLSRFPFRERQAPKDGRYVMLTVARLSPDKGILCAIRAVKQLAIRHPGLEYQIVGEGPERGLLKREIGASANVRLVGSVSSQELWRHYSEAHIFILPSIKARDGHHEETQGVVIQEAQATGLPVIATRTGGIPECVIDGQTGLLVEERSPEALAEAIERLIQDYDQARHLALAGRRFVEEHFDQRDISRRLFQLYEPLFGQA
jgi:colanic acid/amylovoran biosynthesis glycosyltransferase